MRRTDKTQATFQHPRSPQTTSEHFARLRRNLNTRHFYFGLPEDRSKSRLQTPSSRHLGLHIDFRLHYEPSFDRNTEEDSVSSGKAQWG